MSTIIRNKEGIVNSNISLNEKTAYLAGIIIGDGNLSNSVKSKKNDLSRDYRICLDISDKKHLYFVFSIIKELINTKTLPRKSNLKPNRKLRMNIQIRNKELFLFFNEVLGIPRGRKSHIVSIPHLISESNDTLKRYFLAGYFDADGGFRGKTLGFTTASKNLTKGISSLLNEFDIDHVNESWINKLYQRKYYGIKLKNSEIDKFLNSLPLQNEEKLKRITNRFHMRRCRSGQTGQTQSWSKLRFPRRNLLA